MPRMGIALLIMMLTVAGCGEASKTTSPPPEELFGAWQTVTPRGNGFSYEISARKLYVYVGIMRDGTQQYTMQESGSYEVSGSSIEFRPDTVTITRSDSAQPAENYRSPTTAAPRTLTFAVDENTLTLSDGTTSTVYQRD